MRASELDGRIVRLGDAEPLRYPAALELPMISKLPKWSTLLCGNAAAIAL
jgi:hypothetical protein